MNFDYIISIINICNYYNIPIEILKFIYNIFINNSASIIQNKWYDYVIIHNTNLCNIINQLEIKRISNSDFSIINYYYNLNDINVLYSFKICLKYLKPNISDKSWWFNKLNTLNQSLLYNCCNIDNQLYFEYTYIYCLFYRTLKQRNLKLNRKNKKHKIF